MFDVTIKGGTVVDGTGADRFLADLGIIGDRIIAVGNLAESSAGETIDARGLLIAPGFVDVHNHSDGWMLRIPHLTAKTLQGFTTEVLMADGISYAPVDEHTAPSWMFYLRALNGLRLNDYNGWSSIDEYLQQLNGRNVQNAVAHIPYANVRSLACGFGRAGVDDFQMLQIRREIRRGMESGAVGLSTGLDYIVQCHSSTDELVEACTTLKEFGGLYVTHVRYKKGLMTALREAVEIGKRSGNRVHISHLKALSPYTAEEVLGYIDKTARHEVDFTFDVYPYQPGSTMLSYLLPYEVWDDGPLAVLDKLKNREVRNRFRSGLKNYRLDFEHMRIAWVASRDNAIHQGQSVADFISQRRQSPEDALCDLLIEERLAVLCVFDEGDDRLVWPFLQHDLFMVGSDGIFFPDGVVHPRVYGSAGRILGPCVREWKLFSLEAAVHKLSGLPAKRFGLRDRGVIREGAFADVVVFDAERVIDRATYSQPHQSCTGVLQVLVNGVRVIVDGEPSLTLPERLPGRVLRYEILS